MMKIYKLTIPILFLLALAALFAMPAVSHNINSAMQMRMPVADGGDSPWDPGDENDPHPKPHAKRVDTSAFHSALICQKKGDNPWDPGDESPIGVEAPNA
jgi:hypothetical protein